MTVMIVPVTMKRKSSRSFAFINGINSNLINIRFCGTMNYKILTNVM